MTKKELDRLQAEFEAATTELVNHHNYYNDPTDPVEWLHLDRVRYMAKVEAFRKATANYERAIREAMVIKVRVK